MYYRVWTFCQKTEIEQTIGLVGKQRHFTEFFVSPFILNVVPYLGQVQQQWCVEWGLRLSKKAALTYICYTHTLCVRPFTHVCCCCCCVPAAADSRVYASLATWSAPEREGKTTLCRSSDCCFFAVVATLTATVGALIVCISAAQLSINGWVSQGQATPGALWEEEERGRERELLT